MKKMFLKFISCLLVVCVFTSTFADKLPTIFASAAEIEEKERTVKETEVDMSSKYPAGSWKQAKTDKLVPPYGYFHNQVQNYIVYTKRLDDFQEFEKEVPIVFQDGKIPEDHKTDHGRVDVYTKNEESNIAYFWEVKPGSYIRKTEEAITQLNGYIYDSTVQKVDEDDVIIENRAGNTPYSDGKEARLKGAYSIYQLYDVFKEKYPDREDLMLLRMSLMGLI